MTVLTIWSLAIALWLLVWRIILRDEAKKTVSLVSLTWPILIISIDIVIRFYR